MKKLLFFIFMLAFAFTTFGQVQRGAYRLMLQSLLTHSVPEISVKEVAPSTEKYFFLDAREPKEFAVSHIKNAIPVGYNDFSLSSVQDIPHNQPVVVYCSVGYRSEKIAEKLIAAGFTEVYNLYGGIFEWVNQNQPVYNRQGPTQDVHAYSKSWGVWLRKGNKKYD